jgi:hypothetical protein
VARDASGHDARAVFNASGQPVEFRLPVAARHDAWRVLFDTTEFAPRSVPRILRCKGALVTESRSAVVRESYSALRNP